MTREHRNVVQSIFDATAEVSIVPERNQMADRIQDIERLPRRKKGILRSTIDSFLRGATASRYQTRICGCGSVVG